MPEGPPANPWKSADASLNCTAVELSGAVGSSCAHVNGIYYLQPQLGDDTPPHYKCWIGAGQRGLWLYYANDGRWHVGTMFESSGRRPSWRLRSAACKPGTLPGAAGGWQRLAVGWIQTFVRVQGAGRKQLEAAWKLADTSTSCVQISISNVSAPWWQALHTSVNGTYDLQPLESALEAPVFKKRRLSFWERELWLFFAQDGRWHVGSSTDKNLRSPAQRLRSQDCLRTPTGVGAAGPAGGATLSLPGSMGTWQVATIPSVSADCQLCRILPLICFCEGKEFGWMTVGKGDVKGLARAKVEDAWKAVDISAAPAVPEYAITLRSGPSPRQASILFMHSHTPRGSERSTKSA